MSANGEGRPGERPTPNISSTILPPIPRQGTERLTWIDRHDEVIAADVCAEIDKMVRNGWDVGDAADACRRWWLGQVDQWVLDGITRHLSRRWAL